MRVILITGGSRGIGASAALECARRGMGVIVTYKENRHAAEGVATRIMTEGGKAIALPLDVADISGFGAFGQSVVDTLKEGWSINRLSGLVNNAGFGLYNRIETVTETQFDDLLNVHLKGPFFLTQALLPLLENGSSIVNITSATTRVATAGVAPYAAFKGGLEVLSRYMAKEFGERRIRVNSVSPGAIRTELGGGLNSEFEGQLASQTALGRIGEPEDVARVIATLLGNDAVWINAQSVEVAGGYVV